MVRELGADCVICLPRPCYCAVSERLRALACAHTGHRGVCIGCLAEALVERRRGNLPAIADEATSLVAGARLARRRGRRREAA